MVKKLNFFYLDLIQAESRTLIITEAPVNYNQWNLALWKNELSILMLKVLSEIARVPISPKPNQLKPQQKTTE